MKSRKYESLCVGVIYFLILLGIALWVRDIPNQPDVFTITFQQLIKTSLMGDPASFATAAIDIAENGWISSGNDWIFNLWPPGFILLEAAILKTFGTDVQGILVLQILAALLFAGVLIQLYTLLKRTIHAKLAASLPLLIFVFPVSRVFLLEPTGITLGESFSVGFFLLFALLTIRSVIDKTIRYAVYAGLFLALSAYFRSQFEIILMGLTGWGILLAVLSGIAWLRSFVVLSSFRYSLKTIAITLFVAHAVMLPWRVYHWVNQDHPAWVFTSAVVFENSIMSTEYFESIGGNWVVEGGGNLACRIDPSICGGRTRAKESFFRTFASHPVEWYHLKSKVIGKYWFSSTKNWVGIKAQPTFMDDIVNALLLLAVIATAALLFTRKVRSHILWPVLIWLNASLLSAYMIIFTFAHFEVRYFYFPKIAGITMLIVVSAHYFTFKSRYKQ